MGYFCAFWRRCTGKTKGKCSSFAAPCDAAPKFMATQLLQVQLLYASMQLIAAHLQLIWTSTENTPIRDVGEGRKRGDEGRRGSPTKPIGIVGMFTIRSQILPVITVRNCYKNVNKSTHLTYFSTKKRWSIPTSPLGFRTHRMCVSFSYAVGNTLRKFLSQSYNPLNLYDFRQKCYCL